MYDWYRNKFALVLLLISIVVIAVLSIIVSSGKARAEGPTLTAPPSVTGAEFSQEENLPLVSAREAPFPRKLGAGVDLRLTNNIRPQNETSIAGDPNNQNIVVGGVNDYSVIPSGFAGNGVVYSHDGGTTWTHHATGVALPVGFDQRGGDPSVDFDSQSRVFYGSIGLAGAGSVFQTSNGLFVGRSDDGGINWNPMSVVVTNVWPGVGNVNFEDKPYIAVDNHSGSPYQDRVYVSWTRFYGGAHPAGGVGGGDIMVGRSADGGATWSFFRLPVPLNTGSGIIGASYVQGSEPEVTPNGDVYVTFWFGGRIEVWRSGDGGASYSQMTPPFGTAFTVANLGSPLPNESFRVNPYPNIETNPSKPGHVYVVAPDDPDNNFASGDPADIFFARSTDGGTTWSPRVRLNDDPMATPKNQIFAWMAVSKRGAIHVIWYDARNDALNHNLDVYGAFSIDGGASFCSNFRVTDAGFEPNTGQFPGDAFFGDYNGIGTGGYNTFHALWTDTRTGGAPEQEAYYDQITCEVAQLRCPADTIIAGGLQLPQYDLDGFKITNVATCALAFDYALSSSGPGTLDDCGDPASISGTTPVLNPGASYTPPSACVLFGPILTPEIQEVCYVVRPVSNDLWVDSCCAHIQIEPPLPVTFQAFEAHASARSVVLSWKVFADGSLGGFNVYRSSDGGRTFGRLNEAGVLPGASDSYVDADVRPGREYTYRIGAVEEGAETLSPPRSVRTSPVTISLEQNHPNPFNPVTTITFLLPEAERVRLDVFDVQGKLVRRLLEGMGRPGENVVLWDGTNSSGVHVGSGVYYYRLVAGKIVHTRRMVLLK